MEKIKSNHRYYGKAGSALIITVVLAVLLSLVGVMFVVMARVDKAGTSAIAANKDLESAAKSVIEMIKKELAADVPGAGGEYYDYPGIADKWLASLEPDEVGSNYVWRQVSDFNESSFSEPNLAASIIADYQAASEVVAGGAADADGRRYGYRYPGCEVDTVGGFAER